MSVRAVRSGDGARLRGLRLRMLAESPAAFGATEEEEAQLADSHWAELALQSEIADHVAIFIADQGGAWRGIAAGRWGDREQGIAHLWSMWVDPSLRGTGVAEQLVGEVSRWAAAHGAGFLRLGVITRPGDATGFYERLGFVRTGHSGPLRRDPTRSVHFLVRPV